MFTTLFEKLKQYWEVVAGVTVAVIIVAASFFSSKKEKKSEQKDMHDKFVEGQNDVAHANHDHDVRVRTSVAQYEEHVETIELDAEKRAEELSSLSAEELTKSLAERYNIKIEDRKP